MQTSSVLLQIINYMERDHSILSILSIQTILRYCLFPLIIPAYDSVLYILEGKSRT